MKNLKVQKIAKNQFIIETDDGFYFQSYKSIIAFKPFNSNDKIKLDRCYWNYSKTTAKYRNLFLREATKETERKIKSGIYELTNLNQ
jgi:hypothetical protein